MQTQTIAAGLVLEGGGMRGAYTAGILEFFLEKGMLFPYVVGVSAGACNAVSYISRQLGRNKRVTIGMIRDPRYLSVRNLVFQRSMFGMDFIFDEVPKRIVPLDFDTFYRADQRFVVGTTDCVTGEPVYYEKGADQDMLTVVRASSSLPFISQSIGYRGRSLMDGGLADPIPFGKAAADGYERNVVILTRPGGYVKKPSGMRWLTRRVYRRYPGLVRVMEQRHLLYNKQLSQLEELEKAGKAFVFRPPGDPAVSRLERNPDRLEAMYQYGYEEAGRNFGRLMEWFSS